MGKGYSFVAEFVRIRPKMGKIRQQQNHTVDSVTELKSENLGVI